tara:strand:+ start:29 stop:250 length:222 start_codon:yes stop_codon:yes gene_type:complete
MESQRQTKIFEFAKVIGTMNGLSPVSGKLVSRTILPSPPSSSTSSSFEGEDDTKASKAGEEVKKYREGKVTSV